MNTVYKYCCPRGVEILESLEIKVTQPNRFNDPFEFYPRMISTNPLRWAQQILKTPGVIERIYQTRTIAGSWRGSLEEFRRHMSDHIEEEARSLVSHVPQAIGEVRARVVEHASKTFGILCLSNKRDSILMWGHYADKHRGIVIGFDSSNDMFQANAKSSRLGESDSTVIMMGLHPVEYGNERVVYDTSWFPTDPQMTQFEQQIFFSKSKDWIYEEEVRQCFALDSLVARLLDDKSPGYFLPVSPAAVVSVSLGAKFNMDTAERVRAALKRSCFSHVVFDQASLDEREFALVFN